ncbi:hypothetical protein, partial [Bradyrhizobium sp.]|uniref:hypothetical protein n=1 Tax=Bradyrhizobium sp. TaxID=376 RepID=UPI002DFC3498|nr:hypothetical protein [Bradyrhizobium sp.]
QIEASCAGLTRASIFFVRSLSTMMDCRVKPGNDDFYEQASRLLPRRQIEASCAGLTRASIFFVRSLSTMMDCRVKPGNDDFYEQASRLLPRDK